MSTGSLRHEITELRAKIDILQLQLDQMAEDQADGAPFAAGGPEDQHGSEIRVPADGDPVLYNAVIYREWDNATNNIVAIGSETGGADRSLIPTADWVRAHA